MRRFTINPLQYGLSRVRVFGAHNKIHSAKHVIQIPSIICSISNSFAMPG